MADEPKPWDVALEAYIRTHPHREEEVERAFAQGELPIDGEAPPPEPEPPEQLTVDDPVPPVEDDGMTLADARRYLRRYLAEGVKCPCCEQHAQVYRWSLYATAARLLIRLYREGGTGTYVETKRHKGIGQGDASRLRLWELAEREKERRPDGGRSGWWRVTDLGEAFVLGRATIPKYAYVYDGEVIRTEGEPTSISDVLGEAFRYDENVQWASI